MGPPMLELVTQQPGTGLRLQGLHTDKPRRFLFKKAHMSAGAGSHLASHWSLPAQMCRLLHVWAAHETVMLGSLPACSACMCCACCWRHSHAFVPTCGALFGFAAHGCYRDIYCCPAEDFRIFDHASGHIVAVLSHQARRVQHLLLQVAVNGCPDGSWDCCRARIHMETWTLWG